MKIFITGCNGSVGRPTVSCALRHGHQVVGVDVTAPLTNGSAPHGDFTYIKADLRDFDTVLDVMRGSDAVIHLAGFPNPGDFVAHTHNNNVVISWNVLRAAAELGITRVAQASTVNVMTLCFSKERKFHYFPIDEEHPCEPDEPYGLSKQIAEMQATTIVRRFPEMRIASLRLHYSVPDRDFACRDDPSNRHGDLWGYVQQDSAAEAFLLAITGDTKKWKYGHEVFLIAAPEVAHKGESPELHKKFYEHVPVKAGKEIIGEGGFFDCSKAEQLLGWRHASPCVACQ